MPLLDWTLPMLLPPHANIRRSAGLSKRASAIADLIEADLMARGWPVGEVIGTFAELIDHYGVSRAVVREAIGLLEHKMVVEMRHGPGGGVEVRAPIGEAVVSAISSYFDYTGVTSVELSEMRRLLMGLAARLAAKRIDEAGVERLRSVADRARKLESSSPAAMIQTLEVFSVITELSENPAIPLLWSALIQRVAAGLVGGFGVPSARREVMAAQHLEIINAIVAGDASLAEARMLNFLEATYKDVAVPAERAALDEAEAAEDIQAAIMELGISMPGLGRDRRKKLPARVVRQLMHEIHEKELKPGDVLGMERDLLERIGVSRSVFREAVRIIEFYGLAEMRRGPKGGLTVREPDLVRIEETIITYLEYMGIERDHLLEIRIALELMNVEWTIARAEDKFEVLNEIVAAEQFDGKASRPFALHQMLSELSGNRASQLLSNVLSKPPDRLVARPENHRNRTPEELADLSSRAYDEHLRIVEAILAGDVELARHRMLRHLQFVGSELDALDPRGIAG